MLANPIYAGDMVWNRRTDSRFHRICDGKAVDRENTLGERMVPNQKDDWIVVRDAHPALVNRRLFQQVKQRLESHPKSTKQQNRFSKYNNYGKNWNGHRSRFILSGLMECSLCGNRYQGITRIKGKKRLDGIRVKTVYYDCGGYLTKGRTICQMNPIRQEVLEKKVINTVLDFYRPLLCKGGWKKLVETVKTQIGSEAEEIILARKRAHRELSKIQTTINDLLDDITSPKCEFVHQQLNKLKQQKHQLEARLEEINELFLSRREIDNIVSDSMNLIADLEFILQQGPPQEKLIALRQCVKRISINKPAGEIKITIYLVPIGNLQATQECKTSI